MIYTNSYGHQCINIALPNQLFEHSPLLKNAFPLYLIEEKRFFKRFQFHKQKLAYHRATMQFYMKYLRSLKKNTHYIEINDERSDISVLFDSLITQGLKEVHIIDPVDSEYKKIIDGNKNIQKFILYDSPGFINTYDDIAEFFPKTKKKYFQTSFYIAQRKKLKLLLEHNEAPQGGKWSFDTENRKKYPKNKPIPVISHPAANAFYTEARKYIEKHFHTSPGELHEKPIYPIDYKQSTLWLEDFLTHRIADFGTYEDAIVDTEHFLNHSVLTPMLNVGLLTPKDILKKVLDYHQKHTIPLNSLEGFIRQIIGWREFIRGIYIVRGEDERTYNFFQHARKIPSCFYNGTTGIVPIDDTIQKILKTGYAHHIERLMVLGNFMLLCEFSPDEVFRWFMELFVDAYDWVMVPNVYGMSQFADGGLMSTKPYISGSSYIMKMSNYSKASWQKTWDGLYWRFINKHRALFSQNMRMKFMVAMYDKMSLAKRKELARAANDYLSKLDAM